MQQKMFFRPDSDSWVEYNIENDFLNIDCKISKDKSESGLCLYICDEKGKNLSLGTLSLNYEGYSLSKSYPVSYLRFQGIDCENIKGFILKKENKVLFSTFEQKDENNVAVAVEDDDPAVMRAKNLLSGLGGKDLSCEAKEYVSYVTAKLKSYPEITISPVPGFRWYAINDIKETFQLSGVEHLIFCESFVRLFVKRGEWYFGKGVEYGMYALCIESGTDGINPFSNASDCSRRIDAEDGKSYWIVGIGLFSDGQYFCRL